MLTIPEVKKLFDQNAVTDSFDCFSLKNEHPKLQNAAELLNIKLWNLPSLKEYVGNPIELTVQPLDAVDGDEYEQKMTLEQGYVLDISHDRIVIRCDTTEGYLNALSTLKQLVSKDNGQGYCCRQAEITDFPSVAHRSLSTTFAWYAGYGRLGFDMQLWGLDEWKEFLHICSDFKINQLNMVIYGYWPFEFDEYPESVLRGIRMKIWNPESNNWVEMEYMHPNIAQPFLPELIEYGHALGIRFFAYIGLNSYSGGYACAHKEKRMRKPADSKFINDFDSLCLSDPATVDYLKACMHQIVKQGFDGFDFEESEEAFWYCECERCKKTFWQGCETPEETLHAANTWLLNILYKEIRSISPDAVIGIRAWRQPPLVRSDELIREMVNSIPEDVVLFWTPGQYVPDSEFEKWVAAFGRERIYARDTEAIGFASGLGRLIRPLRQNGLRCEEEPITQFVEEDIRQHLVSAQMRVAGINGYQFEWYGFFMAFFAHAYYGWGGRMDADDFYRESLRCVFGELAEDIYFVMTHMFTIHESQLKIFELEFPFAKNKVEKRDIPRINQAIEEYPLMLQKLEKIQTEVNANPLIKHFAPHFKKWGISTRRSHIMYAMSLASIAYDNADTDEDKRKCLLEMYALNDRGFEIVRKNYFDVNPVSQTGVQSCMIPYHELKRVLKNKLYPECKSDEVIYLGVESLGWMWF